MDKNEFIEEVANDPDLLIKLATNLKVARANQRVLEKQIDQLKDNKYDSDVNISVECEVDTGISL